MLVQLDFGGNTFAQVLSSFAVMSSRAPIMELHGSLGSISFSDWYNSHGSVELFAQHEPDAWSWREVETPPTSSFANLIDTGVGHFFACVEGAETPLLTADHACHVLEIMIKARESTESGQTLALETTF